jgi:hypothetical protein
MVLMLRGGTFVNDQGVTESRSKLFEKYASGYETEEEQNAIRACFKSTDHVSFEVFKAALRPIAEHVDKTIPKDEDYIVFVVPSKSNKWVAELVCPQLEHLPCQAVQNQEEMVMALRAYPNVKRIIFFDAKYGIEFV